MLDSILRRIYQKEVPMLNQSIRQLSQLIEQSLARPEPIMVRPCYEEISWWGITKDTHWLPVENVEYVIFHHDGSSAGDLDNSAEAIHKFHTEGNGWGGIGYHFWIRKSGLIQIARPLWAVGAHACRKDGQVNMNPKSWGICLAGNYDIPNVFPPYEQIWAAVSVARMLKTIAPKAQIVGHRETMKTTCPGKNVDMNRIREAVG